MWPWDLLTCSNLNQSCPSPSCLPDDQVWQLAGGSPSPDHESAAQYQPLRIPHMGVPENDMRTTKNVKSRGKKMDWDRVLPETSLCSVIWTSNYLPSLIIDLESQFPSWSQNHRKGVLLPAPISAIFLQQWRNQFGHIQNQQLLKITHTKTN